MTSLAKLENQVKKNSRLLDPLLTKLMKTHKDQYVVFNKGESHFATSFGAGVEMGLSKFGEDVGFVVRKITKEPSIVSALVTV